MTFATEWSLAAQCSDFVRILIIYLGGLPSFAGYLLLLHLGRWPSLPSLHLSHLPPSCLGCLNPPSHLGRFPPIVLGLFAPLALGPFAPIILGLFAPLTLGLFAPIVLGLSTPISFRLSAFFFLLWADMFSRTFDFMLSRTWTVSPKISSPVWAYMPSRTRAAFPLAHAICCLSYTWVICLLPLSLSELALENITERLMTWNKHLLKIVTCTRCTIDNLNKEHVAVQQVIVLALVYGFPICCLLHELCRVVSINFDYNLQGAWTLLSTMYGSVSPCQPKLWSKIHREIIHSNSTDTIHG